MTLTREEFREKVLARDHQLCVLCKQPAVDVHHILERRLFPDGGYYLDNGASLCAGCHILCEKTVVTVEALRQMAGIRTMVLPPHLYRDHQYDKWGNIIVNNGQRLRGELFNDPSVQQVLSEVLHLFLPYVKYPRTYHLPWSPGLNKDDRVIPDTNCFLGKQVVMTEKMDGENTSMYDYAIHARSIDSGPHLSRSWVKQLHARIGGDIPDGWRLCGENMFAKHSLRYDQLESYFLAFSIWNEKNQCLSWKESQEWFALIGVKHVPVIWTGLYDEIAIKRAWQGFDENKHEGYVIRLTEQFEYKDFRTSVAKYVRSGHVQTAKHWFVGQRLVKNALKPEEPCAQ